MNPSSLAHFWITLPCNFNIFKCILKRRFRTKLSITHTFLPMVAWWEKAKWPAAGECYPLFNIIYVFPGQGPFIKNNNICNMSEQSWICNSNSKPNFHFWKFYWVEEGLCCLLSYCTFLYITPLITPWTHLGHQNINYNHQPHNFYWHFITWSQRSVFMMQIQGGNNVFNEMTTIYFAGFFSSKQGSGAQPCFSILSIHNMLNKWNYILCIMDFIYDEMRWL